MVRKKNAGGGTPQLTTKELDAPNDAASLKIEQSAHRLKGSAADANNRALRAVGLFLLERGSKTIDTSVEVEKGRAGVDSDRVTVRTDHNRWRR